MAANGATALPPIWRSIPCGASSSPSIGEFPRGRHRRAERAGALLRARGPHALRHRTLARRQYRVCDQRRSLSISNLTGCRCRGCAAHRPSLPRFRFPFRGKPARRERDTAAGAIDVPALGDPNVRESNSVCVIDVRDPRPARHPRLDSHRQPVRFENLRRQRAGGRSRGGRPGLCFERSRRFDQRNLGVQPQSDRRNPSAHPVARTLAWHHARRCQAIGQSGVEIA